MFAPQLLPSALGGSAPIILQFPTETFRPVRLFRHMTTQLLQEAAQVIPNQQLLINVVSKRVRQLGLGHRPMVETTPRMSLTDIELKGSEVKSIRAGKANIGDAFARIENSEAFLYNADIQPYERASHEIPAAKRVRKLLLHRQEIDKLYGETQVKGRALVVLKLYWKNGKVKAEVGVGTGKLARDKRADLKKRAVDRETAREVARFNRKHA